MLSFDPRHKHFGSKPALYLFGISTLQEQLDCFAKVGSGFFDRRPLTGDVKLGAQGRVKWRRQCAIIEKDGGI